MNPADIIGFADATLPACAMIPERTLFVAGARYLAARARRATRYLAARFRWSPTAVCAMSAGRGLYDDFHDYPDTPAGVPDHFHTLQCSRCGKAFRI